MKKWRVKKLSTALRQSLDDLRVVEKKKKKYIVDMGEWHSPGVEACYVCLAGAVIANRLKADPDIPVTPGSVDSHTSSLMYAINELRAGNVASALFEAGIIPYREKEKFGHLDRYIPEYGPGNKEWWRAMRKLHADLVKAKL